MSECLNGVADGPVLHASISYSFNLQCNGLTELQVQVQVFRYNYRQADRQTDIDTELFRFGFESSLEAERKLEPPKQIAQTNRKKNFTRQPIQNALTIEQIAIIFTDQLNATFFTI